MRKSLEAIVTGAPRLIWPARVLQTAFIATAVLLTSLTTVPAFAQEGIELNPIILGQSPAAKDSEDGSKSLTTRPINTRKFEAVVEVADPEQLKPGMHVDIALATLHDGTPHSEKVLNNVIVDSVRPAPGTSAKATPPEESEDAKVINSHGHEIPELFPTRSVTFLVNNEQLEKIRLADANGVLRLSPHVDTTSGSRFGQVMNNFVTNLFQPLLLFFFMGFAIPLLRVPFEFPKALYQSLTIYLLVAIGWHGGELMAELPSSELAVAGGLAAVGFIVNGIIGLTATVMLRTFTPMRRIDAVTVGSYYGSDSAGTFVTCLGVLATLSILHDSYMPVLLAVMEIPGCLVGLFLISRLRRSGMDKLGNMPGEPNYLGDPSKLGQASEDGTLPEEGDDQHHHDKPVAKSVGAAVADHGGGGFNLKIMHEVFLNPGLYMLFGGIVVGFISGRQALVDPHVVKDPNFLFLTMFKGALCLFLLEMGITACQRLGDLKTAGVGFIIFGVLGPVLFATFGMCCLHGYSWSLNHIVGIEHAFKPGTYALFAVLCGAASYIAVPAVQRIAIPEASPTLPLAASLGLTFTWNVTLGIPIYIEIANFIISHVPVH